MTYLLSVLSREQLKVAELARIYAAERNRPGFAEEALRAMRQLDADYAWRAVWLFKKLAREGRLDESVLLRLVETAEEMTHWASRLNLCQLFASTGCPPAGRATLYPYLVESFADRRPIIRAWAITVLAGFGHESHFRREIEPLLRAAQADPTPSVQARLRQLSLSRK